MAEQSDFSSQPNTNLKYKTLLGVSEAISKNRDLQGLIRHLAKLLPRIVKVDFIALDLHDPQRNVIKLFHIEANVPADIIGGHESSLDQHPAGTVLKTQKPLLVSDITQDNRYPDVYMRMREDGVNSICVFPLTTAVRKIGVLALASCEKGTYQESDFEFLEQVAKQVAVAVDNALAYQEIKELKEQLEQENVYLRDEIRTEHDFEDIIGESSALKRVLQQLEIVAPTDSTVLIQGETGTGKELIARALHHLSTRRERAFVKLNCAAIPTGLLESELFGHEKGAFTGAISRKIGRFELAHGGTIFLDEIGEISLELQTKLLRVLQEKEFERLGSTRTLQVNVRLVAATNRDLEKMVEANQFRSDLYYRLNVFPVTVPALRDRPEDIPVLVRYFTQRYATRMNKPIETVPQKTMNQLSQYHWPGNVRELENLIERAVILSQGAELVVDLGTSKQKRQTSLRPIASMESAEREHILQALRECRWVIGGPAGAATRLGMKRTTLSSKMKKLGIARPY